jgi:hypothetical protein
MSAGDRGRWANAGNLLSQSARFLLKQEQASAIIDEVEAVVRAEWHRALSAQGVSKRDIDAVKDAFAYPGFRLEGEQQVEAAVPDAPPPSNRGRPAHRRASQRKHRKVS